MSALDRLRWTAGLSVLSYGLRVGIRVTDPSVLARVRERLPPGWRATRSRRVQRLFSVVVGGEGARRGLRRLHLVYDDATRVARTASFDEALGALENSLGLYVAEWARRRLFVHAGVVAWRSHVIVIPGRSHSGKSRWVEALVKAGATYYSDEYAVLDETGRVHPFPVPLSRRDAANGPTRRIPHGEIGIRPGVRRLPIGLIAVSSYREGARWRPRQISAGQGALTLLANCVPARQRPFEALAVLSRAVATATVLKGRRGEAEEAARSLLARADWP